MKTKNKHAQALGKLGGLATKKKHGKKHYQRLAENMNRKIKKAKELMQDRGDDSGRYETQND